MKNLKIQAYSIPLLIFFLLGMLLIPMSPFMLDLFFTFNIAFSMLIILAAITSKRVIDFSVFPTILLIATLLRLALNVASTRVVLLNGHDGVASAGQIIEAFGAVLIDGNYAVGFAIFTILIIINFTLITKGATRISEVSARFTLDALPGKQMSIDADLNSGIINKNEALTKRAELNTESEFFGAMDGASKFVRGDAVAGILILFVNLFAGILIGVIQFNLPLSEAIKNYSLLTIGDGLVAQIPALLLSISAAIMVTRVSKDEDLSDNFFEQITDSSKSLNITAGLLLFLGFIPGMPKLAFWTGSLLLFGFNYFSLNSKKEIKQKLNLEENKYNNPTDTSNESTDNNENTISFNDVEDLEIISVSLGYNALSIIHKNKADFISNLTSFRKKISNELGFLIPAIKLRDNLHLSHNNYQILINGVNVFSDNVSLSLGKININNILLNLEKQIKINAFEIFGYKEAEEILLKYKKLNSNSIQNEVLNKLPISIVTDVFKGLLKSQVSIKDSRTIIQVIQSSYIENISSNKLLKNIRVTLSKYILQNIYNFDNPNYKEIQAVFLDDRLINYVIEIKNDYTKFRGLINFLRKELLNNIKKSSKPLVLIVPESIRETLFDNLEVINNIYIMATDEVPIDFNINVFNKIKINLEEIA